MTKTITVQCVFPAVAVKDFDGAIDWYSKVLGRGPDDTPIPGMAQWRDIGGAGFQIWQDDTRAGHAIMTIVVPDLAAEKQRLSALGFTLENEASGAFGSVAQLFDPEGNRINLSEPPKGLAGS